MSPMTTAEALRWANRAIDRCTPDADVYAALLAELRDKDETVQQLRAIKQAAADLLDAAGTHLDRILPISTALLRASLAAHGASDTTPSDDDEDDWADTTQQDEHVAHDDTAVTA